MGFITDTLLPSSFVENEILRILALGIITAEAISFLADRERERVVAVLEVLGRIIFGVIRLVMWAAPLGAFGGMAYTVAVFGSASLASLGALMLTFWATCAFFVFVILGLVARLSGFRARSSSCRRRARARRRPALRRALQARGGAAQVVLPGH